uniref:Reverse transcriptase/retrotransposon-derived protein RNase H-like domain-containing protein n=1 Tax=Amphimedon queenslandica TaxID=400682 RepID=A0A1X7U488_AMPQE
MNLDQKNRELLTVNNHKCLYQYTRLPFGVPSAPAIFQQAMDTILSGVPGQTQSLPVTAKEIAGATSKDMVFLQVPEFTMKGWPKTLPQELKPYYNHRYELFIKSNQSPQHSLASFRLNDETTAHAVSGVPPAEMFLKRCLKTCLDLVKPDVATAVTNQQLSQKKNHDRHSQKREFSAGDLVMFKLMVVGYDVVTLIRLEGGKRYSRMLQEQKIKAMTQLQKERLQLFCESFGKQEQI